MITTQRHFWTTKEIKILQESYPDHGVLKCMELMPRRSRSAIQEKARHLGIKSNKPRAEKNNWTSTPYIDSEIIAAYQGAKKRHGLSALAARLGRPDYWISRRAINLGVSSHRFKELDWSKEEIEILETHSVKTPAIIQKHLKRSGYNRTENAIVTKRHRMGLETVDYDIFTTGQLALMMGVTEETVRRWCDKYGLVHGGITDRKITRQNFRLWLRDHVQQIDMRKIEPNKFWFFDTIFGK